MTDGISATVANALLNAICQAANYTAPVAFYVKLHTGSPGAAGTSNAAGNTTRVQATFGTGASGGSITNTVAVNWTNVSTAETYTDVSFWDASGAGNFLGSSALGTPRTVAVGDNFSLPIGDLTLSLSPLAA